MNLVRSLFALAAFVAVMPSASASAGDLRILVTGIGSDKGEINCALYAKDKGFPVRDGGVVQTKRYRAVPPMLTCTFDDVEPGRYAVAVTHDEDGDAEIDANFEDDSEEAWGVTKNVRPGNRVPKFSEATIYLSEGALSDYEVAIQR